MSDREQKVRNYYHLQEIVRRKLFYALFYTRNVYVWLTKHVRLAAKRVRLAFKITSLGRELKMFRNVSTRSATFENK